MRGTVSWFDPGKHFGFLRTEFGGEDLFLHGNDARARRGNQTRRSRRPPKTFQSSSSRRPPRNLSFYSPPTPAEEIPPQIHPQQFPINAGDTVVFRVLMHRSRPKAVELAKADPQMYGGQGSFPPPGPPGVMPTGGMPPGGGGFGGPPGPPGMPPGGGYGGPPG